MFRYPVCYSLLACACPVATVAPIVIVGRWYIVTSLIVIYVRTRSQTRPAQAWYQVRQA